MAIATSLKVLAVAAGLAHGEPAPQIPAEHLPHILAAAADQRIDPGLLAATAAWESAFRPGALFRAETHLPRVPWRARRGGSPRLVADGSIGPCQILRSNFLSFGVDNDEDAASLEVNYRVGARILRANLEAFRGSARRAVTAYNIGVAGVRRGGEAPGAYTETILAWSETYGARFTELALSTRGDLTALYRLYLAKHPIAEALTLARVAVPAAPIAAENPISRESRGVRRRRKADITDWVAYLADLPY